MYVRHGVAALLAAAWVVSGAAADGARRPGHPTKLSGVAWGGMRPEPKVIYGGDDRRDVYQETDVTRLQWAASVCGLVDESAVEDNGDGTYTLALDEYRVSGLPACEEEPFAEQPTAPWCTGFMVGPDLIATAGHCFDQALLPYVRFVFGFQMADAATPVSAFDASQVYEGVEVVGRELAGEHDYCIVRVDRPITAPGAQILPIRRSGEITAGTVVGLIGHPSGLPLKLAFSGETQVLDASPEGYFTTNTDSYGGNSGSPVFNPATGLVEGILVRGADDFTVEGGCFQSITRMVEEGAEDVSKAATFAQYVITSAGFVRMNKSAYACSDVMTITVGDLDLIGGGPITVSVAAAPGGDMETVTLTEQASQGQFSGSVPINDHAAAPGDGVVNAAAGDMLTVTYKDADTGTGAGAAVTAQAPMDCLPPGITGVSVTNIGGASAIIRFTTDEPCFGIVRAQAKDGTPVQGIGSMTQQHAVRLQPLQPLTGYRFTVEAVDAAGNGSTDNNGGEAYAFVTGPPRDYLTEYVLEDADLAHYCLTFTPDGDAGYHACYHRTAAFPVPPEGGDVLELSDDSFSRVVLGGGKTLTFFGVEYDDFYVGSNGYITFGAGDADFVPDPEWHFVLPRVAGLYTDLAPHRGGQVLVKQLSQSVSITWLDVPDIRNNLQSFQIEFLFDGDIRLTWLTLTAPEGIAGLSDGGGLQPDFTFSDLTSAPRCVTEGLPGAGWLALALLVAATAAVARTRLMRRA